MAILLSPLVLGQNSTVCTNIESCLTTLSQGFTTLCNGTIPTPSCSCPVEWESFNMVDLGAINMASTSTQTYTLPDAVPTTAKQVLVYVFAYMGYSQDLLAHLRIYTESSPTRRFEQYLLIKTYNQDAYGTSSANIFFPMPSNRRVYVNLSRTLPGNVFGRVSVIGYR